MITNVDAIKMKLKLHNFREEAIVHVQKSSDLWGPWSDCDNVQYYLLTATSQLNIVANNNSNLPKECLRDPHEGRRVFRL